MNISKEGNELVIRLPMEQDAFDVDGELVGSVPNLIGVIEVERQGIHQLIDMTYKNKDPQIGDCIVQTYYDNEEFKKKCEEFGISIFECPVCSFCKKEMCGSYTLKDGKISCFNCDKS